MIRFAAPAVLALLLAAAPAAATPSFSLQHEAAGPLDRLGAQVVSRLTVTGSDVEESFHLQSATPVRFFGDIRVVRETAVGPGARVCDSRWQRLHDARGAQGAFHYDLVVSAGRRATIEATDTLVRPPWPGEAQLGAVFEVTPAGGAPMLVATPGLRYQGPLGVRMRIAETGNRIVVTTVPVVNSGRIELRAFRSERGSSVRIASLAVRHGIVSKRWIPRPGNYEVYALFRPTNSSFGADATECGMFLKVRRRA